MNVCAYKTTEYTDTHNKHQYLVLQIIQEIYVTVAFETLEAEHVFSNAVRHFNKSAEIFAW